MKLGNRIGLALRRGLARADTWVAAFALFFAGSEGANGRPVLAAVLGLVGVVFLVASGDYCWRRGYAAARRER